MKMAIAMTQLYVRLFALIPEKSTVGELLHLILFHKIKQP